MASTNPDPVHALVKNGLRAPSPDRREPDPLEFGQFCDAVDIDPLREPACLGCPGLPPILLKLPEQASFPFSSETPWASVFAPWSFPEEGVSSRWTVRYGVPGAPAQQGHGPGPLDRPWAQAVSLGEERWTY